MSQENVEIVRRTTTSTMRSAGRALHLSTPKKWLPSSGPTWLPISSCTITALSMSPTTGRSRRRPHRSTLGHSKIQTTFDCYGHLFPGSHDEVRERMDAYLLAATEPGREAEPTA
jgi:hypothetical protein